MSKKNDETLFDQRTLLHLRRQGVIDDKSYEAHLKALPDCESNVEYVEMKEEPKNKTEEDEGLAFSI
ncbi:MAG: hypothetical protein A3I05_09345 [Deltaproteobacteria bacterium RIFCSPLOWO2_02_FULL_44_10]|nr:MAG: hypothetical protein A3C46_07635 [Deltaproteobacteria bacterium RIFCSPHIGHO2_02_FULL_44_16]OGQ47417.1 MAG: hypothetical protein A3I05_09345 [Deltaproteobacteria bacterium RIFCSPLOWO2_02_FULL_44_10]